MLKRRRKHKISRDNAREQENELERERMRREERERDQVMARIREEKAESKCGETVQMQCTQFFCPGCGFA